MTTAERILGIFAEHSVHEGQLLPILNAVQGEFGWFDAEAERVIAAALDLRRAEDGVVSFTTTSEPSRTRVAMFSFAAPRAARCSAWRR